MSPILSFHHQEQPPPFSTAPPSTQPRHPTHSNSNPTSTTVDSPQQSPYPPSYKHRLRPSASDIPHKHHKPRNTHQPQSNPYGQQERDRLDGGEADGLLFEMEDLDDARARERPPRSETVVERRRRGEEIISAGGRGWFGAEIPSRASWREIREMVYEVGSIPASIPLRLNAPRSPHSHR